MKFFKRSEFKRWLFAVYLVVSCQPSSAFAAEDPLKPIYAFMESTWPMPAIGVMQCPGTAKQWRAESDRLLSLQSLDQKKVKKLDRVTAGVLKNALISYNYARLYLRNRANGTPIYDYWIGIASQASSIVGRSIRAVFERNNTPPPGLQKVLDLDPDVGGTPGMLFYVKKVGIGLAVGNQAVYHDIYWQFLAAHHCGSSAMVNIVNSELPKAKTQKEISYWRQLQKAWTPIDFGLRFSPTYNDLLVYGTQQLIIAEQLHILQPAMYDALDAKFVNSLGTFNPLAVATLPSNGQTLEPFASFAARNNMAADLSNGPNRVAWMFDFTKLQMADLDQLAEKKVSERAYRPVFREAALIVSDYLPSK